MCPWLASPPPQKNSGNGQFLGVEYSQQKFVQIICHLLQVEKLFT